MMNSQILLYISTKYVNEVTSGGMLLLTSGLSFRAMIDIYEAYQDPEISFGQALIKCKKRIFRAVIAMTATSIVSFVNSYY